MAHQGSMQSAVAVQPTYSQPAAFHRSKLVLHCRGQDLHSEVQLSAHGCSKIQHDLHWRVVKPTSFSMLGKVKGSLPLGLTRPNNTAEGGISIKLHPIQVQPYHPPPRCQLAAQA